MPCNACIRQEDDKRSNERDAHDKTRNQGTAHAPERDKTMRIETRVILISFLSTSACAHLARLGSHLLPSRWRAGTHLPRWRASQSYCCHKPHHACIRPSRFLGFPSPEVYSRIWIGRRPQFPPVGESTQGERRSERVEGSEYREISAQRYEQLSGSATTPLRVSCKGVP